MMSTLPREQLPTSLYQGGSTHLCDIESGLTEQGMDLKLKNRHWYNFRRPYLRLYFDVRVVLGAADLKFQLISKGREIISQDHEVIHVKWEPVQPQHKATESMASMVVLEKPSLY